MLWLRPAWIQESELSHLFGKRQATGVKGGCAWSDKATVPKVPDAEASASPKHNEESDALSVSPRESGETPAKDMQEGPAVGGAETARADDTVGSETETRWWLEVSVGGFRIRTLYDTGASHTVMGAAGLQIAAAMNQLLTASYGRRAKVVGGHTATIAGYVELPFEVAGIKRDIRVAVIPEEDVPSYLSANFTRAFSTVRDPDLSQLFVRAADKYVDLEVAGVETTEPLQVASIGLGDVTEGQRAQMLELVTQILGKEDPPLGCTSWMAHRIDVGGARPVKQRYYPVSKKLEEEMHRQVHEMLENGVIEPPNSAWSSPVVMIRKSNEKYRFCIDFRKLNAVSSADAYPLPYMNAILWFMGMVSWYRDFLKDFATFAAPLTVLTKKDRRYEWGEE